jgi:hypothetical protein
MCGYRRAAASYGIERGMDERADRTVEATSAHWVAPRPGRITWSRWSARLPDVFARCDGHLSLTEHIDGPYDPDDAGV